MSLALIVGSGEDVESELSEVLKHVSEYTIIGVNFGATVIRPDILFGNHLRPLCEEIAPKVSDHWGYMNYEIHTTPLPGDRKILDRYPWVKAWPDAYRPMCGSGLCAALAAKLMGFSSAIMVGCPHGGKYNEGRHRFRPEEVARKEWGANKGEAGADRMMHGLVNLMKPELIGFATSMSGATREHLGAPAFTEA